ncbi:MAG: hypothetical protein HUJ26_00580 [Planctomycetaceae bacterium]|nr:hypothetical protein [Planctomycetaceae bacterium]
MNTAASQNVDELRSELEQLRSREREIERLLNEQQASKGWSPQGYYGTYYALTGSLLGLIAAMVSLLLNVVGSVVAGKGSALELIRVYLTFPLGEKALLLSQGEKTIGAIGDGMILAFGCCLYLFTGMLLGVPIYMALARFVPNANAVLRVLFGAILGLIVWGINFYGILSWLQPLLFEKAFITSGEYLPPWVAAVTHAVFGVTIAAMYPLGEFHQYIRPMEKQ